MRTPPVPRDRARSRPASCRAISAQEAEQRTGSETCRRRPPRSATSSAARAARAAHVDRGRRPHDAAQPTPSRSPAPSSPGSSAERCRSDLGPHHDGRPYVSCGVAAIRPLPRSQLEHLPAAGRETRNADARTQRPPGCRTTNRATRTWRRVGRRRRRKERRRRPRRRCADTSRRPRSAGGALPCALAGRDAACRLVLAGVRRCSPAEEAELPLEPRQARVEVGSERGYTIRGGNQLGVFQIGASRKPTHSQRRPCTSRKPSPGGCLVQEWWAQRSVGVELTRHRGLEPRRPRISAPAAPQGPRKGGSAAVGAAG